MKKLKTTLIVLAIVILAAFIFFAAPNLNPLYRDGWFFWGVLITAGVAIILVSKGVINISAAANHTSVPFSWRKFHPAYLIIAAAPWVILVAVSIFSLEIFHSDRFRDQMPQPQVRTFTADMQPLDVSELPIVDADLAYKLADKELGEKPSLGSQVTLGTPTIQKVNGKLIWAVPLQHSGFFKWLANLSGTPGYIVVSATNPRDVTYVDKYNIKYQPGGFLLDNLRRHTRLCGGLFTGLTDYSFELDDTGRPFWVVTTYQNRLGFSMPEATGAIIVDAQTGSTATYSIANMPGWVDRIQPESYVMTQLNNRGEYIHGIFNFSNKDKFKTSSENIIVYNKGRCYLFTGTSSVGGDQSATGFMLVDMVTKQPFLYQTSGATQKAAQSSAEGKVQHLKYNASYPLITNVEGAPTYFMTLKDSAGLIKQYAFVSVKDYTTVGTGETIDAALGSFRSSMRSSSAGNVIESGADRKTVEGTVLRIAAESQSGSTVYKFTLTGEPKKIFIATYDISNQLALTKEGDKVSVNYTAENDSVNNVESFKNITLP